MRNRKKVVLWGTGEAWWPRLWRRTGVGKRKRVSEGRGARIVGEARGKKEVRLTLAVGGRRQRLIYEKKKNNKRRKGDR